MNTVRYVTEEEYNAICEKHSRIARANERVAKVKNAFRAGAGPLTLAEKLAALRKAAKGEVAI